MSDKPERLVLNEDGTMEPQTWPAIALVSADLLRSPRVRIETGGFGFYALRSSAIYREVPRDIEDPADAIRLHLVSTNDLFRANNGPLLDSQVSPEAATPTIAPLAVETNEPTQAPFLGSGTTELAASRVTGGGIDAPNVTTSDAEVQQGASTAPIERDGQAAAPAATQDAIQNAAQTTNADGSYRGEGQEEAPEFVEVHEGIDAHPRTPAAPEQAPREDSQVGDLVTGEEHEEPDENILKDDGYDNLRSGETTADNQNASGTVDADAGGSEDATDAELEVPSYSVEHRGRGSWSVLDEDKNEVVDGLTRAQADEVKSMDAITRAEYVKANRKEAPSEA